jgi:hypothetical protein
VWKATKKVKHVKTPSPTLRTSQGTWARNNVEKAHAFAEYSKSFSAASLRKLTRKGRSTYTTSGDPLPTRTNKPPVSIRLKFKKLSTA